MTPENPAGLREAAYRWADTPDNDPDIHEVEEALLQAVIHDRAALAADDPGLDDHRHEFNVYELMVDVCGCGKARVEGYDPGYGT